MMRSAESWLPSTPAASERRQSSMANRIARLTKRHRDCLRLVAEGYTSKEIGRRLGISFSTVDNHLHEAKQILEVANRSEAARRLVEHERAIGQELPRQPEIVASDACSGEDQPQVPGSRPPFRLTRLLPPIGGRENDLPASQRIYAIATIALFSTLAFVACAIVIRASFDALR